MSKHKWKELSQILGCPYNERFKTDGYGEYRIDCKGLYSYEDKGYCEQDNNNSIYLDMFISGIIDPLKINIIK